MRTRKILASLVAVACLVFLFGIQPADSLAKEKFEEKFEKTVSLAKDGKVILSNISGDIEVKTWDKGEVSITALKVSKANSKEQAQKNFEQVKIEITEEGKTLRIETKYVKKYFNKKSRQVSVNYWLTIPSKADANVTSVSGDVSMEKIGGSAKATSVSGDVDLALVAGAVKGKSVSGNVKVAGAKKGVDCDAVSGDLELSDVAGGADLKSVSGNIHLKNCSGDVEAEVVSGDVTLMGISDADEVSAKTVSGSVKYVGNVSSEGSYDFNSLSGNVTLTIPADSAFDLSAKTFSGHIDSEFEIAVSGKVNKKRLKGTVKGGGAEVEVKTFSGSIYLKKQ